MKFEWDAAKRRANLVKHELDFADAEDVFHGATFTLEDERFAYSENRFITIGMLRGTVIVIAHTEEEDVIRVISMRKATRYEEELYFQGFANGLGTD
jgi:uncharacterized DUF497 family protein